MTSRDFCFWLQGFFELRKAESNFDPNPISATQVDMIERHLNMVFENDIDPSIDGESKDKKEKLDAMHNNLLNRPPGVRC